MRCVPGPVCSQAATTRPGLGLGVYLAPLVMRPPPRLAPQGTVEEDEEPCHDLVVARGLGQLEQPLDEWLMAIGVERMVEVFEQEPPRGGPAVAIPSRGKGRQGFRIVKGSQPLDERRVAPLEQLLEHQPVPRAP